MRQDEVRPGDGAGRPLAGCRVLDFTAVIAGPYCTRWLADLGAEVLKIEPPEGDYIRVRPPLRDGYSTYFGHLNCGKRSVVLDLKRPGATALVRRLAAKSDVVVENFRPGVMRRLGLGYDDLAAINPGLVYCSISGFGQTGPAAERPAYAPIVHAASGFDAADSEFRGAQTGPTSGGIFIADVLTAAFALSGIQAALLRRQQTGEGQLVDTTLMESMLSLLIIEFQMAQFPGGPRLPLHGPLRAKDGHLVFSVATANNFEALCEAVGRPDWRADARFATTSARSEHWADLTREVEAWTLERPAQECEARLTAAGVPCSRFASVRDVLEDPALAARGSFARVEDGAGAFLVPNLPFRLSATPVRAGARVPRLGEDTAPVLQDVLGMSEKEVGALRDAGVLRT